MSLVELIRYRITRKTGRGLSEKPNRLTVCVLKLRFFQFVL